MGSLRVAKRGGGKTPVILLYQKIILFASKKLRSCRNTWKNVRFRFLLFQLNLWIALQVVRNIALSFFHAID
ncbi:hypothetical protein [Leptospira borgpetersenii]|uniref:hypothetical protein n=1 Tax=Leptospira borgpetersenii TaxID=174 RepID=UPI00188A686D|nr:hypothetical protein [Leptospira borgpetersenii]